MTNSEYIIYEQPLNELMRLSLRLEYVLGQMDIVASVSEMEKHPAIMMRLIIDCLQLLDRPDLKPKLTKAFNHHIDYFSRLDGSPDVSPTVLKSTLRQLKQLLAHFLEVQGKIAQPLRDNEFLSAVRQSLLIPGGGPVDVPAYHYWLHQSLSKRRLNIKEWLSAFKEIHNAIALLLNIVRASAEPHTAIAKKGFYHEGLDPKYPCQLLRIGVPTDLSLLPEISAGKHRMSIRFLMPEMHERMTQSTTDVSFQLTKCTV